VQLSLLPRPTRHRRLGGLERHHPGERRGRHLIDYLDAPGAVAFALGDVAEKAWRRLLCAKLQATLRALAPWHGPRSARAALNGFSNAPAGQPVRNALLCRTRAGSPKCATERGAQSGPDHQRREHRTAVASSLPLGCFRHRVHQGTATLKPRPLDPLFRRITEATNARTRSTAWAA